MTTDFKKKKLYLINELICKHCTTTTKKSSKYRMKFCIFFINFCFRVISMRREVIKNNFILAFKQKYDEVSFNVLGFYKFVRESYNKAIIARVFSIRTLI